MKLQEKAKLDISESMVIWGVGLERGIKELLGKMEEF
jgi:hypothetical protein